MTRPVRAILLAVLITALPATGTSRAANAERPRLAVEFELLEPAYHVGFDPHEITAIETAAAVDLAEVLRGEYPFVDFAAESGLDDKVLVQLGEAEPETNIRPVRFHLTVDGPRIVAVTETARVPFRRQEEADKTTGSVADFRDEIAESFAANLDRKVLVRQLFSKVMLTRQAFPLDENDSWFWILPFSQSELGITIEDSVFRVKANLTFPDIRRPLEHHAHAYGEFLERPEVPAEYHNKLMTRFEDKDSKLDELRRSQTQEVVEVCVEDFERLLQATLVPATPSSLTVGEEDEP